MFEDLREVRLQKMRALREAGINPYAERFPRTHSLAEAYALAEEQAGQNVVVAGRVMTVRAFGKLTFFHLQDGSGRCQIALDQAAVGREALDAFAQYVDMGDHVGVVGRTGRTKKGEPTVFADEWTFLSKALRPLPEKWHGLSDIEARQRDRVLDLVANPGTRDRFRLRTRFVKGMRRYLDDHGFEEVDTPVLQTKASGALARPFLTHHNALDMELVLRIAPETWLKQCVAGGLDRVYEVARCFRNEGMDPSHLQDFTMVEWYAAYWNYQDNMDFTEGLVLHLLDEVVGSRRITYAGREIDFTPPWPRRELRDLVLEDSGIDYLEHPDAASLRSAIKERGIQLEREDVEQLARGTLIDLLYKKVSRPKLVNPVFVTGHPIDLSPLARKNDDDPGRVDRYQLVVNGWEVVNAYSELVDPVDQRARFESQAAARAAGDDEALEVDEDYLRAMEYGMPPMSGWGMGVDRFVALLTDQENLREVVLFPLVKPLDKDGADDVPAEPEATETEPAETEPTDPGGENEIAEQTDVVGTPADDVEDLGIAEARARALFDEWVTTPSLRRQMEQSSVVMEALARRVGGNEEAWRLLGLLHNLDFDRVKDADKHCLATAEVLRAEGVHPAGIHAICAHNDKGLAATGVRCVSRLDHAVSCAEAVVGLIHASAQVLPSKDVKDLKVKSVRKRFKNPKFAANVERDLILRCEGVGLSLDEFIELAVEALQQSAEPTA